MGVVYAWPVISRPTASFPRRCVPPTRRSRSTRARSRHGLLQRGCANRPAVWPMRPTALRRLAEIDRRNRTEHLTGIARLESRLGRVDAGIEGRSRLAGGFARQSGKLRVLCPALLPAWAGWRRGSTPSAARCAPTPPSKGRAQAGGGAGGPVPNGRSHRDVLASF